MIQHEIAEQLEAGKSKAVKTFVQQAIDEGVPPQDILKEGLLGGMGSIGEKFKRNEVFVPEVLMAARAMNQSIEILKPLLQSPAWSRLAGPVSAQCRGTCTISVKTWSR